MPMSVKHPVPPGLPASRGLRSVMFEGRVNPMIDGPRQNYKGLKALPLALLMIDDEDLGRRSACFRG